MFLKHNSHINTFARVSFLIKLQPRNLKPSETAKQPKTAETATGDVKKVFCKKGFLKSCTGVSEPAVHISSTK